MARNATLDRNPNVDGEDFLSQALKTGETADVETEDESLMANASNTPVIPLNQRAQDSQFKAECRELLNQGLSRPEIAKRLNVKYQLVYAATKDMKPGNSGTYSDGTPRTGGRVTIKDPVTGEQMNRADYIKREFAKGRKRVDIAKELDVAYQIVFQATKDAATPRTSPTVKIDETPDGNLRYLISGALDNQPRYANTRTEADAILETIKEEIKQAENAKKTTIKPIEMTDGGLKFEVKVGNLPPKYATTRAEANEIAATLQAEINAELGIEPEPDEDENPEGEGETEQPDVIEVGDDANDNVEAEPDNS